MHTMAVMRTQTHCGVTEELAVAAITVFAVLLLIRRRRRRTALRTAVVIAIVIVMPIALAVAPTQRTCRHGYVETSKRQWWRWQVRDGGKLFECVGMRLMLV